MSRNIPVATMHAVLGIGTLTLFATGTLAQAPIAQPTGPTIKQEQLKTIVKPGVFEEVKRQAIPFKGWELMDPKTRKPVGRNDKITLPDGKVVPAGEYYDQLNALEADLNKTGATLKNKTQREQLFKQTIIDKPALADQGRVIASLHKPGVAVNRFTPAAVGATAVTQFRSHATELDATVFGLTAEQLKTHLAKATVAPTQSAHLAELATSKAVLNGIALDPNLLAPKKNPAPVVVPVHENYPFNWSIGSASTFQAYLRGKATIDGQAVKLSNPPTDAELKNAANRFTLHGDVTAGGAIFGNNVNVLTGTADFSANNKQCNARVDISVLGQSVYQLNESAPSEWSKSDTLSKSCDFHTTVDIPVSILTLSVKVGASGQVGIQYGVSVYAPMAFVQGSVSPFVHTNVYAQAGIGIGGSWLGVDGGVGANMTLLNDQLDIDGEVGVLWFINFGLFEKLNIHNKLDMLSGRLYVYAEFNHPCFPDFWNGCSNQVSVDLWNWSGFHTEGDLLTFNNSHPL